MHRIKRKNVSRFDLIVYLQVSIITDVTCPTTAKSEDWDSAVNTVRFFFSSPQPKSPICRTCSYFGISPGLFLSQL